MVCSASFEKSTHLVFDERPMPKIALFQGVHESWRHKKARTNTVRAFFELEVMSQAVGLAKVALEQASESLAVVDVLDYMPVQCEGRDSIMTIINTLAEGIVKYQEPETGVWWQVTDQNNRKGNYLESSASSLFVYFLCKAVNKGYIPVEYKAAAERGFNGLIKQFIKEEPDGSYTITNCCAVAGLGGKGNRDGSFAYYIGEPVIENDPKSVGSFILAAIEYEKMKQ